jgi:hypothetical protein
MVDLHQRSSLRGGSFEPSERDRRQDVQQLQASSAAAKWHKRCEVEHQLHKLTSIQRATQP